MWGTFLGRSHFRIKCKSALSRTKTRLEVIKKKRNAMQKFLKRDIADLLHNNLDYNAYGRADGLYIELNLTSCYDYVERYCRCIADRLKDMDKQRECLEDCKEAASSLVYAAARFADLPELRDFRALFSEKYGDVWEPFVNKEFAEKLKLQPPTREMKFELMRDIAEEFSIQWQSKSLEHLLYSPQDQSTNLSKSRSAHVQGKQNQNNDNNNNNIEKSNETTTTITRRYSSSGTIDDFEKAQKEEPTICAKEKQRNNSSFSLSSSSSGNDDEDNASKEEQIDNQTVENRYLDNMKGGVDKKPQPRSVRRRFLRQEPTNQSSSQRHMRVNEQDDNDEKVMDRVLKRDNNEILKSPRLLYKKEEDQSELSLSPGRQSSPPVEVEVHKVELPLPPGRRRYLMTGNEPRTPMESNTRNAKASPFRSWEEKSETTMMVDHVHPKLPDYDELQERIIALQQLNVSR